MSREGARSPGDLERLLGRRGDPTGPAWFRATITQGRLEAVSLLHSAIYTGLLVCAFALHNPQPITTVLGLAHGLLWIGMSLICLAAARYKVIPWWLAVAVVVLGGIGPFFGSGGFLLESRRRRAAQAAERPGPSSR